LSGDQFEEAAADPSASRHRAELVEVGRAVLPLPQLEGNKALPVPAPGTTPQVAQFTLTVTVTILL